MTAQSGRILTKTLLVAALVLATPAAVSAQGRGNGRGNGNGRARAQDDAAAAAVLDVAGVALSVELKQQIRDYYVAHPVVNVEALPPGIRRNLARGKPLPPGIAKKVAPAGLTSTIPLRAGYELVEVGLDVFLVEVATNVVHDVLMDVIR
jgi:hypothetical protein